MDNNRLLNRSPQGYCSAFELLLPHTPSDSIQFNSINSLGNNSARFRSLYLYLL